MPELSELIEQQGRAFEEFKAANDRQLNDIRRKFDDVVGREKVDRLNGELDRITKGFEDHAKAQEAKVKSFADQVAELKTRTDLVETTLKRTGSPAALMWKLDEDTAEGRALKAAMDFEVTYLSRNGRLKTSADVDLEKLDPRKAVDYRKGFERYLRQRKEVFAGDDFAQKALYEGSDPEGGYFVPPQMMQDIIRNVRETTPIRQFVRSLTIGRQEVLMPRRTGVAAFAWAGETQARPETNTPTLGQSRIATHEFYAAPEISPSLLEDGVVDVEAFLAEELAESIAIGTNTAFMTGSGVEQPRGMLTYPAGTADGQVEQIVTGDANAITSDSIINLAYALKETYAANARFLLRRSTRGTIRKLKDGQNNYLWHESYRAGEPASLLGYPVVSGEDMPAVAAGALPILFGDIRRFYTIVERLGLRTIRDDIGKLPMVRFYSRGRIGGDVVVFEAAKILKVST